MLIAASINIETVCMLLAVMAHGAVPVIPPASIKMAGLLTFLRKKEVSGLFAPPQSFFLNMLLKVCFGVKLLASPKENAAAKNNTERDVLEPPVAVNQEQPALISHSSGSTGKSKAIVRSHRTLKAQHEALKLAFPPLPDQRDFPLFPNILLHNLSIGACSIIPCLPGFNVPEMEPEKVLGQMEREEVHTLTGNVYYFKKLLKQLQKQPQYFPAVKALGIGGSPVPEYLPHAMKKYFPNATFYIIYGSTEAEPIAIRELGREVYEPQRGYGVGAFHPTLQWRIRATGKVQVKEATFPVGEVEVKGPHVVPKDSEGWLATGDFGYVNREGRLFLTGRKGNERVHAGVQHYQLEHFLQQIEGVETVAAIAKEEGFAVFVQGTVERAILESRLQEAFPSGIIRAVHFRKDLPVDPRHHSKILYAKVN